ncbi:DNA topoisomerase 2 [Xylographa opegraphella]|nr:DNA topoisomerase 2 [Xylographa opegraphella]
MDDSIVESVFDDGGSSDNFSPVVAVKSKAKAAPKAVAKKAVTAAKAAPKKMAQSTLKAAKPKAATSKKRAKPDSEDEGSVSEVGSLHDDTLLSATPPSAKKQKKEILPKKKASKPLQPLENEAVSFDGVAEPKSKKGGNAEQYQKLTQLEHIIKRPDTYIGSVERSEKQMWVYNTEADSMEMREVSFVPGLYKIFDEILVNAADNKQRDKNMNEIKITVDREKGEISVWNNGRGIPIEIHEKEKIYIPEMIFGHLLTSSNYDDEEAKVTGGRNGYGAKLCNVFSTKFVLETADSKTKKKYKQTWTDNMTKMGPAAITENKGEDYTKITFSPDFRKFKMDGMDDDIEALMKRRVYDLAGTIRGVKVSLNGKSVKVNSFKKYMEMYTKAIKRERGEEADNDTSDIITDNPDVRWEIGFAVSDGTFQQVSFVNSIATTSGGTHVNYIADQVCDKLMAIVKKKNKGGATLKPAQIRNHIFLFVNCLIVNPAFTSQTKEQLTTKASQFGSKCQVSDKFLNQIAKTDVITNILAFAQQKADQILKKSDGTRRSRMDNPKLTDANKAGTKDGHHCTLILTEGDSAKGLAMAGRSVVGPDLFGVFPLRGKLLNVRDASVDQVSKNAEIQNIKNILGLKHKQNYIDCKSLRYGHIMIMTDQDHDGSHIKGLLINFLQVSYPSLLKIPEFLIEFITPIVKVYKGDPKQPSKQRSFFTIPEYEAWREEHKHERGWEHKYYKGLGTSTTEDAQVYFRDLDKHLKDFHVMQENEPELIELAFSKKKADERKEWLRQFKPGTYLDHSTKDITYTDFVNKELILFSMADNLRSIPSVIDGLKPGQRKVLYACFKKNLKKDMKVVELAGYVSGITAYQHGETSLQQTIVGLAQTFVGSNNVNCLEPSGNFGSRLQGGSDSASARYIYTRLSPFARRVFHPLDEPILKYNTDDDHTIEPEMYVPVVPMVLINGADGIGTGWSSSIPNYNPEDIVENLKRMMDGLEPNPMTPWFRDFKGEVTQMGPDRYKFSGIVKQTGDTEVEITELPIRVWTQDFKDKLVETIKAEKGPSWIKEYDDYNTHKNVHFVIRLEEKFMKAAIDEGLEEKFKLTKSIATSNLVAFDAEGRITKYATVEDILKEFFALRIKFYEKRKEYQLSEFNKELEKLTNQARFIQMIIDGKLVVSKKKKKALVVELKQKGFKAFPKTVDASKEGESEPVIENEEGNDEDVEMEASAYDYLLGMAIWSLTQERVEKLLKQIGDKELEIDALIKLSKEDLWKKDLDEFIHEWRFQLEDEAKRQKKVASMGRRLSSKLKTTVKGGPRKRKNEDTPSDSDFSSKKMKAAAVKNPVKKAQPKISMLSDSYPALKATSSTLSTITNDIQPSTKTTAVPKGSEKPDEDVWMTIDGVSDSNARVAPVFTKAKEVAAIKKAAVPKASKAITKVRSDSEDEPSIRLAAPASRAPRAAARKPVKYSVFSDSDSDNGDDMLFDVGKMVKGIGPAAESSTTTTRPLFSATTSLSRPGSSAGLVARKSVARTAIESGSEDETDYTRLVPAANGGTKTTARATVLSDEDDDSDVFIAKPAVPTKSTVPAPKPAGKPRGRPPVAKALKAAPVAKVTAKEPKKLPLSPAAKAYAAKQAKANGLGVTASTLATGAAGKEKPKAKPKYTVSDEDDEDDDVDKIADEMLSEDDDDDDDVVLAPAARAKPDPRATREDSVAGSVAGGRPARRAAAEAVKKTWVLDEESEEEEDGASEAEEEDTADFDDSE